MSYYSVIRYLLCFTALFQLGFCQQFTSAQIPNTFVPGNYYPTRSGLNARQTEDAVCRPIADYIDRNSARFNAELVTNTNSKIRFQNADSRIMSSRMQSRLDRLADLYTAGRMTIKKAWSQYPDSDLTGSDSSLHFEGRTVSIELSSSSHYDSFLKLAIQAAFDWVYYESNSPRRVRLSVIPSSCERSIDVVFMLDRSGSVGAANHRRTLDFINTAVSFFTIGRDFTRVGVVAYATYSYIQFDLDDYTTPSSLTNAVNNVAFTGGWTNSPAALDHARQLLTPSNGRGARPNSEGIPKIAILITDGQSNRGNLNVAITNIRNTGIQVYAVGIGNIDINQLRAIATDPDDDHVFILRNYLDAGGFVDLLSATTCDTPAVIDTGNNVTNNITDGGINYYQTSCAIFSNKVLVELIDISGSSDLFASSTELNPGPLTPDTQANTTTGINRKTVTVTLTGSSKIVYIGVQGQTDVATFTILVWDQLFNPVDVFINVIEGPRTAEETIYNVSGTLINRASQTPYTYSFIEGKGDGIFAIDPNTGRVFIPAGNSNLNFDNKRTHNLTVQTQNRIQNCQISRIRINIRVISNSIDFNAIPTQPVSETSPVNTEIVQVIGTGGLGNINYSIVEGNNEQKFSIDSDTGRLFLTRTLNFETTASYAIRIRAEALEIQRITGETPITINVLDVNESPLFITACATQSSGCSYTIPENTMATTLGTIQASDPDLSTVANGMLQYQLQPGSNKITINNTGILYSTVPLDRETQSVYTFTLTVSDRCSGCALTITTTVRVTVTDVNDNPPVFTSKPATLQVREDLPQNTVVAEYRASDADEGSNSIVEFILSPSTVPFTLSSSGSLSLTGQVDFESVQSYAISITALNPGTTLIATTTSMIQILNVNDNTPVISGEPYVVTVAENSGTGTLVTTVTATDGDLGIHGEIRYTILSGNLNQAFTLNPTTGALTVNANIDRESVSSFNLVVRVRDRGTPQTRQVRTTIAVTVGDVNDNAPIFRPSSYSVQLREDLPVGEDVIRVLATDADQPNTANSNISYSITSGNTGNAFSILSNGQIQISQRLDFETTPSYSLTVEGRDGGSPAMSSTATVAITIINVNENPPTLTGDQSVNISESAPIGSTIAVFQAQDQDQMAITLSIPAGNAEGKFMINTGTGVITLSSSLDYETTTMYNLTIRASDGEQNTDSELIVRVLDENEFRPEFSGTSTFMILEELPAKTEVGTIMATDRDRDAQIVYTFVGQNQAYEKFDLNRTSGVVRTSRILDREVLTQIFTPPSSQVTLQVAATDNGSPSRQSFRDYTITLTDINDNTPTFSDSMYSNQLRENLPAGQEVFSPSATDIDLGTNAEITYSFTLTNNQGSSAPFQIDSATGAIITTAGLDCELQPIYLFSITATDRGSTPLSSTVTGQLTLIDENDNSPQFSQDIYFTSVDETLLQGTTIMTFAATDADKGSNGEIEYRVESNSGFFIEGQTDVVFNIDRTMGRLFAENNFDYEQNIQVNVTVFANDRGLPRRSNSTILVITVNNIDEAAPVFFPSECMRSFRVSESVSVGTIIGYCNATDEDTTAADGQTSITYTLSNNAFFMIDPVSAAIRTKATLDHETNNGVTIIVITATDLNNLAASRSVTVSVSDVNDNPPQFINSPYSYQFTNRNIRNNVQEFLTLEADDRDAGENGAFTFSVGEIMRISENETLVPITVQDNGVPSLKSTTNVTVTFESPCQLQAYSIISNNKQGQLSVRLLCSVAVASSSVALTLQQEKSLFCTIIRNTPAVFQWLHNSTAITNSELVQMNTTDVMLTLENVMFSSAGQYACKVTSDAGSLQSVAATATVQVIPSIILQPTNVGAEEGTTAIFHCVGIGIPTPTIKWFIGTQQIGTGDVLRITNVSITDDQVYTCAAINTAGQKTSSAQLIVYAKFNVIQMNIVNFNKPIDGQCQYFNPSQLEATINSITKQKVMVTSYTGSKLCDLSPCVPSPCQNGGTCALKNVVGGYTCSCRNGYTGVNCTIDVNECIQSRCGNNGNCINTMGSFRCECNQNYTGRFCQFERKCVPGLCPSGKACLDDFSGHVCKTLDLGSSVVVTGLLSVTTDEMTDFVQLAIDQALQAQSSGVVSTGPLNRRKRQVSTMASLNTTCQPNFVSQGSNTFILVWTSCPSNENEPNSEQQQILCSYFFNLRVVAQCKLPDGNTMNLPRVTPPSATSVKVNLVFINDNSRPINAVESVKSLQDKATLEALARSGITVDNVVVPDPRQPEELSTPGPSLTLIIIVIVCGLVGLVLLVFILFLVGVCTWKKVDQHKEVQRKKKERAQQVINLDAADSNTLTQYNTMASTTSTDNLVEASKF